MNTAALAATPPAAANAAASSVQAPAAGAVVAPRAAADASAFDALLGGANAPADTSISSVTPERVEAANADDEHDDARADAADATTAVDQGGDWLLALRQSLNLAQPPANTADAPAATAATASATTPPATAASDATAPAHTVKGEAKGGAHLAHNSSHPALPGDSPSNQDGAMIDAALLALPPEPSADYAGSAPAASDLALTPANAPQAPPAAVLTAAPAMTNGSTTPMNVAADPAAAMSALTLTHPADHDGFVDGVGERIVWITDTGLDQAQIELHPAELGALTVHVKIRGDEAQVSFSAEQPATRALLQNAVPQLRELFNSQGLQLMRAQIDARTATPRGADAAIAVARDDTRDSARNGRGTARRVSRLKLVDAYA